MTLDYLDVSELNLVLNTICWTKSVMLSNPELLDRTERDCALRIKIKERTFTDREVDAIYVDWMVESIESRLIGGFKTTHVSREDFISDHLVEYAWRNNRRLISEGKINHKLNSYS